MHRAHNLENAMTPHLKVAISDEQIDDLVRAFYIRIRQDAELGPIFHRAIGTDPDIWSHHEARIASFWRNAVGLDRSFSGNPMQKHLAINEIEPEHFPLWLAIFRQTAEDTLPASVAQQIAELADRIGRSLSWGVTQFRQPTGAPPVL